MKNPFETTIPSPGDGSETDRGLVPSGETSADGIAGALGLSSRTLRRQLSDCGVSYPQLLDGVRYDLARQALARPSDLAG